MKLKIILVTLMLFMTNLFGKDISYLKFTNKLLVDRTFYIEEKSGYDTIVKFYLNDEKLRMFYVIFYENRLEETMTLDAKIDNGSIFYTVFNRPTELKLEKITDKEYIVKEFHNHSKEPKYTLILQFSKPKGFAK